MRKIDYLKLKNVDIKDEYITILGLKEYDEKSKKIQLEILDAQWKNLKADKRYKNKLSVFSDSFETMITCDYSQLVKYYLQTPKLVKSDTQPSDNELIGELIKIFDYSKYASRIKNFFNKYVDDLDLYSCPYCETAYTGFFDTHDENGNKIERSNYDVDHFIPKSEYPMFALSLFNFVPSCQMCNQRIKHTSTIMSSDYFKSLNDDAKEKFLLKVSPVSKEYDFSKMVNIKYIPFLNIHKKTSEDDKSKKKVYRVEDGKKSKEYVYDEWHYFPISQDKAESYKVFFDTDTQNEVHNKEIINLMKLEDRYNSAAIKNYGLYLMDLKKKYSFYSMKMMKDMFNKMGLSAYTRNMERDIFHLGDKYALLKKLKTDTLE